MSSALCLRCLRRSLEPTSHPQLLPITSRAPFSTSTPLAAAVVKKKPVVGKPPATKKARTLKLSKKKRVATGRPPAVGERKAYRKRVIISNPNALAVQELPVFQVHNVTRQRVDALYGKVVGLQDDSVEALRALEAFKPTQGWRMFRQPATVVRTETVEIAGVLQQAQDSKTVTRQILTGERGSGKSVLALQAMTLAHLRGWAVINIPEARDIVIAHTAYQSIRAADGSTVYIQPEYTAKLLKSIATANETLFSTMRLSQQHQLPVPVPADMTLSRFVQLGAGNPQLAWPVWQALLVELTAESQPTKDGLARPPIMVALDGLDQIMRVSSYLDPNVKPIHAHSLALVRDFVQLLSGQRASPNGGLILGVDSASTRTSVPTLDHFIEKALVAPRLQELESLRDSVRKAAAEGTNLVKSEPLTKLEDTLPDAFTQKYAPQYTHFRRLVMKAAARGAEATKDITALCDSFRTELPAWDLYVPMDSHVAEAMKDVTVKKVAGLSREEARGLMEYYARSGMLRDTVTDGLVRERWTLAGHGVVGQLERGALRA